MSSPRLPFSMDSSAFLTWDEEELDSESETAVVFRSLVATVKLQPELDNALEAKAMKLLELVGDRNFRSPDDFLITFGRTPDEFSVNYVQSILVLISSASQIITAAAMEILRYLFRNSSAKLRYHLVKNNLVPQLMTTLNPQSLSLTEAVDIHIYLLNIVWDFLWLSTPVGLAHLGIKDGNDQQAVHETVLTQVLVPSEAYISHLCLNRFSIIDGEQSKEFMTILAHLLPISPSYQPAMDFIVNMPVFLTIPSYLTFTECEISIWCFLYEMIDSQREWNKQGGVKRPMWKKMHRMLRMEGIEDVLEEKLQTDQNTFFGRLDVTYSIDWNKMQADKSLRLFDTISAFFWTTNTICDRGQLWHHLMVPSMIATLSFTFVGTLTLLLCGRHCLDQWMDGGDWWEIVSRDFDSFASGEVLTNLKHSLSRRRSSVSIFIALTDDAATSDRLSPHSSPNPTPTDSKEGRDCCWLTWGKDHKRTGRRADRQTDGTPPQSTSPQLIGEDSNDPEPFARHTPLSPPIFLVSADFNTTLSLS
ncbi:hypothetical protein BLNAU_14941 [Blattamonas nauphoetae]|uniref:Uncharacterized protein n=1 Tax=Blattamonas nauphoetae TaxID=2049346 RepID=A0ABQ9XH12_9EUKA|nr:hypothetical protein BLNAU_14941 [Blattamonas nauphoetae]